MPNFDPAIPRPFTLARVAGEIAASALGERGQVPITQLGADALTARLVHPGPK